MAETGPDRRHTDLALAALLLAFTVAAIVVSGLGVGQIVGGVAVTLVALVSLPLRRTRPRTALAILTVVAAVGYAAQLPSQILLWPVLAFAMVRGPIRSGWLLTVAVVVVGVVAGTGFALTDGEVAAGVGYGVSIGLQVGFYTALGAVLGRISRTVRAREEAGLQAEEQARSAAALAVQRTRIADELDSGVLDGLRRLAARTAALGDHTGGGDRGDAGVGDDVAALERDSRDVLTRMRRALTALREPGSPDPVVPDASAPSSGTPAWLPTRRGLALAAAIAALASAVGMLPLRPIGQVSVDRGLSLLDVPWSTPAALVSLAVQVLAVAWWRSAPAAAFVVATAAAITTGWLGGTNAIVETSWMFLVYAVATGVPPRRSGVLTGVGTLAVLAAYLALPPVRAQISPDAAGTVLSYLVVPFLWYAGVRRREHRIHAGALRRERHEDERREALETERLRVARDLHDVVAHHVSAIAVQAGAARVTTDDRSRSEALSHIAESGRRVAAALPELERLTPDAGGVALTADGVDDLLRPVRDAGVTVACEVVGAPVEPAGDPELFAQRILTEALTNVVRHAGATDARVRLEHRPDAVAVQVSDAGPVTGHRPYAHGSGLGMEGMRERAGMLGGRVDAGPGESGGWRVHALLPRIPASAGRLVLEEERPVSISSSATTRPAPGPA